VGAGILVGYFSNRKDAGRALRVLERSRFLRAALVHKTADGDVHIRNPFLWRRGLAATLAAILFGVLAGSASLVLDWSVPPLATGHCSVSLPTGIIAQDVANSYDDVRCPGDK
jgi:site-specific recombinase